VSRGEMKIGSLFSGIGGLELGLERALGWSVAWQVEQDDFCRRVLAKHWPKAERFDDVRTVGATQLARVDLICGGFPCQDVSGAGLGRGIVEGTRSGLWIEFDRIVGELAPEWVVVENVASGKARWLSRVQHDLRARGYDTRAYALSAADVGAPHLRRRIFVVGHADRVGQQASWPVEGSSGETQQPDQEPVRGDVANADGNAVRVGAERIAGRRPGNVCEPEGAEPVDVGAAVADRDRDRRERESTSRIHAGGTQRDNADRRHGWPPRRGDGPGWTEWTGPQPGIRGGTHGFSVGVDGARLKALGNAVVPQCAEAIGRVIAELIRIEAQQQHLFKAVS